MKKSDIRRAKEMLSVTNNIQKIYVRKLVRMRKNALNKALKLYEQTQNIDLLSFIEGPTTNNNKRYNQKTNQRNRK